MTPENNSPGSSEEAKPTNEQAQPQGPDVPIGTDDKPIKPKERAERRNDECEKNKWKPAERWEVTLGVLLFIFTVITACVYIGQLRQMKKATKAAGRSAKAAEDAIKKSDANSHLDQRAWVTVSVCKVDAAPALDEIPTVTIIVGNTGRTPALKVHALAAVYVGDVALLTAQTSPPLGTITEAVIGPNAPWQSTFDMRFPLTDTKELDALKEGKTVFLYLVGAIYYEDIFQKPHCTTFCHRLRGKPLFDGTRAMWAGEIGNNAD